jgi:hypothetical protein
MFAVAVVVRGWAADCDIMGSMTAKTTKKPKLTDAERHKRFVEMAREVEAEETPKSFDRAFAKVVKRKTTSPKSSS